MNTAELKKNIWIYSNRVSFIAIGIIYLLVIALSFSFNNDSHAFEILSSISLAFFTIFTSIWGTLTLGNSIISEVRNRTWIYQKMSALSAVDIGFGKLFGPVLIHWIMGFIFLIVGIACAFLGTENSVNTYLIMVVQLLLSTLIFHATAITLSLLLIKRKNHQADVSNLSITPIILLMLVVFTLFYQNFRADDSQSFLWYGIAVSKNFFNTLSLLYFAGWSLIGLYRNMQDELNYNTKPSVWIAFNIFIIIYFSGLIVNDRLQDGFNLFRFMFVIAYILLIVITLVTTLLEATDKVSYRELFESIKSKNSDTLIKHLPLWSISLIFSFIVAIVLSIKLSFSDQVKELNFILPITVLLYLIKSVLVNIFLHLKDIGKANLIWFFYLVIWYGLLPAFIFSGKGWESAFVFYPVSPIISTILGIGYVVFMIALIVYAIKRKPITE